MLSSRSRWEVLLGQFLEKWVCGHLEGCLLREYGTPARLGILDWVEIWHRVLARPRSGHHLSTAAYWNKSISSMVIDRIGFDFDSNPRSLSRALRDALVLLKHLREHYGADGALQFTGRRGYRVWVFLKRPLDPSIYPDFLRALLGRLGLDTLDMGAVLDRRHLFRIPYTLHEATGKRARFLDPRSLEPLRIEEWDYELYEPLDPRMVKIVRVVIEPPKVVIAKGSPRTGSRGMSRYKYIEDVLERGLPDGRKRFILYVASRYLVNVKGLGLEEALEELQKFLEASCRNHGNCGKIYHSWLRSVLRGVEEKRLLPPGLSRLREKNPELYALVSQAAGLTDQPAEHSRMASLQLFPEPIRSFLKETGLRVFTYEDLKQWLESRKGRVSSSEWSRVTRQLRRLAEKGLLGRMFQVEGEWVDYGPGPVEKPPLSRVKFYIP
ncbi:MAG: DNA primase noncatalytic subunit PriX [Desulfurococcales archaeon]|nr:DNA primase noncatalytic subunit PriX [Desulfurococcales archaeon]